MIAAFVLNPAGVRLGKSGLKVSKIILGCMSFGSSEWEGSPWVLDEEKSLEVIKAAWDGGINTWVSEKHRSTHDSGLLGSLTPCRTPPTRTPMVNQRSYSEKR